WTTGIALSVSVLFLVGAIVSDVQHSLYAIAALAMSYPAYKLSKRLLPADVNPRGEVHSPERFNTETGMLQT
ncbi:MAG: hypothetical protein RML40_11585, partial [Bacteroidota bacterium]|nr:hypothetical protein [Candidatus Kapabacteria bacterium]MDW8221158.1 hypothetical protein [Bacteroidota bacterium]